MRKSNMSILSGSRRTAGLGVLQHNLENDVPGVATTVDPFFEQLLWIAQKDDVFRIVIAVAKVTQKLQLELICCTFESPLPRIHLARGADIHPFAQLFD